MAAALRVGFGSAAGAGPPAPRVTVTSTSGTYEVRGEFATRAPLGTAWEVLTDYAHIASFVSSMQKSELVSRDGDSARVRQAASVGALTFHRTMHVMLAVREEPQRRIGFVDLSGQDFSKYVGAWTLRAAHDSTVVAYALDAAPHANAPRLLSRNVMSRTTGELLSQVRTEIEKRAARR